MTCRVTVLAPVHDGGRDAHFAVGIGAKEAIVTKPHTQIPAAGDLVLRRRRPWFPVRVFCSFGPLLDEDLDEP